MIEAVPFDSELLYTKVREIRARRHRLDSIESVKQEHESWLQEIITNAIMRSGPEAGLKRSTKQRLTWKVKGMNGHRYPPKKVERIKIVKVNGRNTVQVGKWEGATTDRGTEY